MRVLLQRVSEARVEVDQIVVGSIRTGFLMLVGFTAGDGPEQLNWMVRKCVGLRVFPDENDKMNRALLDVGGALLVVSQFTLYGNMLKGNRPSFVDAAPPDEAERLYQQFIEQLRAVVPEVQTGRFGANMQVHLVNDGPVSLWLEREP